MYRKQTLSKKIDTFMEDVFWVSYIMFIVFAPIFAVSMFVFGLYTTFFA